MLLGASVGHSPTPLMMGAAFRATGIDAVYQALSVGPAEFASVFESLRESGVDGMNVTMPYKGTVPPLLDALDVVSSSVGVVNTIRKEGRGYKGYNTDVYGIVHPLKSRGIRRVAAAAVLGTGGASRAFVAAMHELGCERLTAISRRPGASSAFFADMKRAFPSMGIGSASVETLGSERFDLFFNASPCGSNGIPIPARLTRILDRGPTVFDAVYFPVETELIRQAGERHCPVVYGHEMLLHQGAEGFRIWTGEAPPLSAMREALMASLEVPA
ncbi:MAG: shikimate dehydrogenase [Nitrososphaerota archaeon]|nr:shikimate dehydrogenase [Nitrososphaerota archaeon]